MTGTLTTDLGDTIPTMMEEAMFTQQFKAIMRALCWPIKKGKGSNINVPYFGEVSAAQLSEGVDMTADQKMSDTNVQIVPYEVGLKIILSRNVVEDDNEDLKRAAGRIMGDAYEKKRDADLLALLDNGTTSLAASANALTMGHIAAARATLLGNLTTAGGPAPSPFACVIHPYQELDLVDILTPLMPTSAGSTGYLQSPGGAMEDAVLRNYAIGKLFGIPVISDGNMAFTALAAKGGVFSTGKGGALIYGIVREPTIETDAGGGYDASLRGWELVYAGRYGVGNYLNGWTVELFADATAPA